MRFLPYLVALAMVIAAVVWMVQQRPGRPPPRAIAGPSGVGAPAMLAAGSERGPGTLHLTATQLVFSAASGRVLVIERLDIVGASTTHDLPDRHSASPVLAVRAGDDLHYFLVDDPEDWLRRLT